MLCSRRRCILSAFISVNTNNPIILPLMDAANLRQCYLDDHCQVIPRLPSILCGATLVTCYSTLVINTCTSHTISFATNSSITNYYDASVHHEIPFIKLFLCPLLPHFIILINYPNPTQNDSISYNFVLVTTKYASCYNAHVIKDKSLFVENFYLCRISTNVDTVTGNDKPKCIGIAEIKWNDNNN